MPIAETRGRAMRFRHSYGRNIDDVDELVPTRVFTREGETSRLLQGAPPNFRGRLPSERALIERMLGELCSLAPTVDASRPLKWTSSNVFMMPPRATDPPPPWAVVRPLTTPRREAPRQRTPARETTPRTRRSILPFATIGMVALIGLGLWRDDTARASVVTGASHAASRVGALLVETAVR